MKSILKTVCFALVLGSGAVAQETLSSATADVGSSPHTVMTSIATVAEKAGLANVQVQEGQALTRVQLAVAKGELDMGTIPQITVFLMSKSLAMFKDLGAEQGAELAGNLKAITGFQAGVYNPIVFSDSGIDSWDDLKGKRVFVGAPTGGAAPQVQQMIKIITGMSPGEDFEAIKLDWGAGVQGMLDGKIDVLIRPGVSPAPFMDRLTSAGTVRILGVPQEVYDSEGFTKFSRAPGTVKASIDASLYDADKVEVLNSGNSLGIGLALVANAGLDEGLVYELTKAHIANLDALNASTVWAPSMELSQAIYGLSPAVGLKMHAGAIKAWEEAGVTIPDHLK